MSGVRRTSEGGLLEAHGGSVDADDAQVGRHFVAHCQVHDVTQNELSRRQAGHQPPVPLYLGKNATSVSMSVLPMSVRQLRADLATCEKL